MRESAGKMAKRHWDSYWIKKEDNPLFNFYRKQIFARAVDYYINRYFPRKGVFVEAGCGSGQTSARISKHKRTLIAVDFSAVALKGARKNKKFDRLIQADISKLPFKSNSIDGIWNLGVMEHLTEKDIKKALDEFYRVLKKDRHIILFWATKITPYQLCLDSYNRLFKKNFQLFPDEHNRLASKTHARKIISKTRFKGCSVFFSWRDLFTDIVIVARK